MSAVDGTESWTNRGLLGWMEGAFAARGIDEARLSAELLLEGATGQRRVWMYAHADRPASVEELGSLRGMVRRVLDGEPVQYVLGEWSFFGVALKVDRRALIPRSCTEVVCEEALQHARRAGLADREGGALVADIGTGSGAIVLSVLKHLRGARGVATDVSGEALSLAAENAERLGLSDRVAFVEGDGLGAAAGHSWVEGAGGVDLLLSNPPYIPDDEWEAEGMVDEVVRAHEPVLALRGGVEGMDVAGPILEGAAGVLRAGGLVAVEVAASRAGLARGVAEGAGLSGVRVVKDLDGLERVVVGVV